jgi:hypothetical protein
MFWTTSSTPPSLAVCTTACCESNWGVWSNPVFSSGISVPKYGFETEMSNKKLRLLLWHLVLVLFTPCANLDASEGLADSSWTSASYHPDKQFNQHDEIPMNTLVVGTMNLGILKSLWNTNWPGQVSLATIPVCQPIETTPQGFQNATANI